MDLLVGGEQAVDQVHLGQEHDALQLVVVEGPLPPPGPGAVEPGLGEGGPGVLQQEAPPHVVAADPRHAGEDPAAALVLDGVLPEEDEDEGACVEGRDEVGLWAGRGGGE